jgi:hypothetical protein
VVDRLVTQLYKLQQLKLSPEQQSDDILVKAEAIGGEIDKLWRQYRQGVSQRGGLVEYTSDGRVQYGSAFTAMIVAYFAAARILLSAIRDADTTSPPSVSQAWDGQTVLNSLSFLAQQDIGCAYLRMFLPLTLVALYSRSDGQRTRALEVLEAWFRDTSFSGLSSIAVERVKLIE